MYFIWSHEHNAFWKPNRWGYTTQIKEAGIYSVQDAEEIVSDANIGGQINETKLKVEDIVTLN